MACNLCRNFGMKKIIMDDSKSTNSNLGLRKAINEAQNKFLVRVKPVRAVLVSIFDVLYGYTVRIILHLRSDVIRTISICPFLHVPSKVYSKMVWSFLKMKNNNMEVRFCRSLGTNGWTVNIIKSAQSMNTKA